MYDWMNESVTHIVTSLPKHCISPVGTIRGDLLKPAPIALRESMSNVESDMEQIYAKNTESETK